jgi:hypothetical protein
MGEAASWVGPVLGAVGGYMGSKSSGNQQDVTTTEEMPDWLRDATQWNINRGQSLANQPYTPYEGQRFAGFDPMQQNAMGSANLFGQMGLGALGGGYNALNDMTGANMMGGAYGGLMGLSGLAAQMGMGDNDAQAMLSQYFGAGPAQQAAASLANRGAIQDVSGGSFLDDSSGSLQDYMNPYTEGVMDNVLGDLDRSWQQQDQAQRANANAAGAFGGSRHGILDALSTSEYQRNAGQLSNQLWNQAYGAATNLKGQDLSRGLQAGLANQGMDWNTQNLNANLGTQTSMFNAGQGNQMSMFDAGNQNAWSQFNAGLGTMNNQFNASNRLQGMGLAMSGMGAAGGLGNMMGNFTQNQGRNLTDYGIQGLSSQMNAGNMMQGQNQQQLDFDYQQFLESRGWFGNQAQYGINPLQGGYGGSTTQPYFGPSPWQGAMGGAMMGSSLWDMFGNNNGGSFSNTNTPLPAFGGQGFSDVYAPWG